MALQIVEKEVKGVIVLELSGRIILGEESSQLRNKVRELLNQGKTRLVLDLGNVAQVDSTGLGTLVASYTTAQSQGTAMKLANLTKRVDELMHITKLVTVFETYDSVDKAVQSFK